jgi:hypothetical protein
VLSQPMRGGRVGCCARAASGHETAAPPTTAIARFIPSEPTDMT